MVNTMTNDITAYDLLSLVSTPLRKVAATRGGEYHGPCPQCGGKDRFVVQPCGGDDGRGLWMCRACHPKWGDVVAFVEWRDGVGFREACDRLGYALIAPAIDPDLPMPEPCEPPSRAWQERGKAIWMAAYHALWQSQGDKARAWLRARGLSNETIEWAALGYIAADTWEAPSIWGLPPEHKKVYLPRGIVIPWPDKEDLWKLNIRRPLTKAQAGESKYIQPAGAGNGLFNADTIMPGMPIVLVEGEFDALIVQQEAGDLVSAVATGSTAGARRARWLARFAVAPLVLVAFDNDGAEKGEAAARYWLDVLEGFSVRWRPLLKDPSEMIQQGLDVRAWVEHGLTTALEAEHHA